MPHARIVDDVAVEIVPWNPEGRYPAEWVWEEVSNEVEQGATRESGEWVSPLRPPPTPEYDPRHQRAEWDGENWTIVDAPEAMGALKAEALEAAMAYGNAITSGEISQWAGVEPLSWTQQKDEAKTVRAGGTLDEDAVLPGLAEDKGVTLAEYADGVWANAMRYQAILRAAVHLRRSATAAIMDEAVTTPEQLEAVVTQLRAEADALAGQLIG